MTPTRKAALIAGALYLVTFVTSIPPLLLKAPILKDLGLLATGGQRPLLCAAVIEIVLAASCVGTAVALYPIVRPHGELRALGFVASRTVEAGLIMLGVVAMLALVSWGRAGSDPSGLGAAHALVSVHDATFLLGPGLMPAVNALLLGSVLYQARLVPRLIPLLGLIGAPLLLVSAMGTLFGFFDQVSPFAALAALPIALWEASVGVWLLVRGVSDRTSVTGAVPATPVAVDA